MLFTVITSQARAYSFWPEFLTTSLIVVGQGNLVTVGEGGKRGMRAVYGQLACEVIENNLLCRSRVHSSTWLHSISKFSSIVFHRNVICVPADGNL